MNAPDTNDLRRRIVACVTEHPDLPPREVARRVGCARSAVYRFLARPQRDGRTIRKRRPLRTNPRAIAALATLIDAHPELGVDRLRHLLAERARADSSLKPVPSRRTIARLVAVRRASLPACADGAPPVPSPLLQLLAGDAFDPEADHSALAANSLAQLLQLSLGELAARGGRGYQLRQQAAAIASALARAAQRAPRSSAEVSRLGDVIDEVGPEVFPFTHGLPRQPADRPRSNGTVPEKTRPRSSGTPAPKRDRKDTPTAPKPCHQSQDVLDAAAHPPARHTVPSHAHEGGNE